MKKVPGHCIPMTVYINELMSFVCKALLKVIQISCNGKVNFAP